MSAISRCWTMCIEASCSPSRSTGEISATNSAATPPAHAASRQPAPPARRPRAAPCASAARTRRGSPRARAARSARRSSRRRPPRRRAVQRAAGADTIGQRVGVRRAPTLASVPARGRHAVAASRRRAVSSATVRTIVTDRADRARDRQAAHDPARARRAARDRRAAGVRRVPRAARAGGRAALPRACRRALPVAARLALPALRALPRTGAPAARASAARALSPRVGAAGLRRHRPGRSSQALKFRAALPVADLMAAQLAATLPAELRGARGRAGAAAAAPARRRGFDPAGLLARRARRRGSARRWRPCCARRDRAARQVRRGRSARRAPGRIDDRARARPPPTAVLLVDDVHTTGATLDGLRPRAAGRRRGDAGSP